MKLRLVAVIALLAAPALAHAEDNFNNGDQIRSSLNAIPINPRYQAPQATGGADPIPPASALAPVPENILHHPHAYQLGEASVPSAADAKGTASTDHRRRHARSGWRRHRFH
jgi:hypothetical protein